MRYSMRYPWLCSLLILRACSKKTEEVWKKQYAVETAAYHDTRNSCGPCITPLTGVVAITGFSPGDATSATIQACLEDQST